MSSTRSSTRQVVVDDRNPLITFSGTWGHDAGISGVASASHEKLWGPPFNGTATFSEVNSSFSFTFKGTDINVNGGINFIPTGTFARCFIDGVATDNSTDLMIANGLVGTNNNSLCGDTLHDGTHVLTFNLSGMGSYRPARRAKGAPNRVWIDGIAYTPSSGVAMDTVPAIQVSAEDSQIKYSSGWILDSDDDARITTQNGTSMTFTFQGISVDYYGTLLSNISQFSTSSTATYSIDGQAPITFSIVDFYLGSTPNRVPLFSSGILPAGKHTLEVVNQGNSSVMPLALQSLIVVPSADSAIVNATRTHTGATTATTGTVQVATTTTTQGTLGTPSTTSVSALGNSKQSPVAIILGITTGLLAVLFVYLFFRWQRRRRGSRLMQAPILPLSYPDITAIPPTEIPTPLPLAETRQRINLPRKMARFLGKHSASTPPRFQPREPARDMIRRSKLDLTLSNQDAVVSLGSNSRQSSLERNPGSEVPSVVIDHDDSGTRLPQSGEAVHRVIEFPPAYAPQ